MALSAKLTMRQGQAMVLTPQLLQAIKLLQMPNVELSAFIEGELTSNPLLERAEEYEAAGAEPSEGEPPQGEAPVEPGDWATEGLETDSAALAANLGTEVENAFDSDRTAPPAPATATDGLSASSWAGGAGSESGEAPDLEAFVAETLSLHVHLERQAGDPRRLRHPRARRDVSRRKQQRGAAARAGQLNLCGDDPARREAGRG